MKIIHGEGPSTLLSNIVLKLGGFHIIMSFVGYIGQLKASSGLKEVFELVYAANTVEHMMSGKAISRAIRGHTVVQTALNMLLMSSSTGDNTSIGDLSVEESLYLYKLFDDCLEQKTQIRDILADKTLTLLKMFMQRIKQELLYNKTAKVWLLYLRLIELLQKFITAERTEM